MKQICRPTPARPDTAAQLPEKAKWLLMTHGFDARANKVVILYEPSEYCNMTLEAFKTLYMPWWVEEPRQRGAPVKLFATTVWCMHERRIEIAGVRMRPDKNFPAYEEDGVVFKNTYRQPEHVDDGTGEVQTFLDFLDRFLPAVVDNDFWLEWMAHKLRRPDVPGTSVWFVANDEDGPREGRFGTGRGLMFRILHALYGPAYCKSEDFDILAGTSAQAVYTDWQAYCVLATVDEAHVSPTAYRRGEKRSVYTALKNCIDPAAKRRSFKVKGGQTVDATSFCSVVVATNHANAAAIPENDRRISVLRNGREMTPAEAIAIDAWMKKPANIAALANYLMKIDLAGFNMYEPLKTEAKAQMAEQALSHMDEILGDFAEDDDMGLVFPRLFLERAVEEHLSGGEERTGAGREWRGQFAGAFDEHCAPVRPQDGAGRARVRVNGKRYRLYCFRGRSKAAAALNETERRAEAAKWGSIDSMQTILREVKPGP